MTFLSPALLWTLLALIPLVAVYFLKVRPRRQYTTAYFLWEKIFNEKKATSLLSKLRDLFSLLLLLLAFVLLAFALARPTLDEDSRKDLLIIVDRSASMGGAALEGGQRLDVALDRARDIARALNGNQRAALVTVDREVSFVSNFTESPRALLEAIDQIEPSELPLRSEALRDFLDGRDSWGEDLRIIFLTDGQFAGADGWETELAELLLIEPVPE
ncbi:MAG: BatA and WFA domain-containing protein, partial [Verrucomicrobiota bacterium]